MPDLAVPPICITVGPAGAQNLHVYLPPGAQPGQVAVLFASVRGSTDGSDYTLLDHDGWTLCESETALLAGQGRRRLYSWFRVIQPGDEAWTFAGVGTPGTRVWSMVVLSGCSPSPKGDSNSAKSDTNTTNHAAPGVTTAAANSIILCAWTDRASAGSGNTPPGSMDHVASGRKSATGTWGNCDLGIMSEVIPSAGATGTRAFTAGVSSTFVALTMELLAADSSSDLDADVAETAEIRARIGVPKATFSDGPSDIERALRHASARLFPVATFRPKDLDTGEIVSVHIGGDRFIPATGPEANETYKARGATLINIRRSMFAEGRLGGAATPTAGDIAMLNGDGKLDALLGLAWDDREAELRLVGRDRWGDVIDWDRSLLVHTGRTASIGSDEFTAKVAYLDIGKRFEQMVSRFTFGGGGGLDGTPELRGTRKPIAFGKFRNLRPICVDPQNQIYVVSTTGAANIETVHSIDAVYVGANLLSPDDYEVHLSVDEFTGVDYIQIATNIGNSQVTCAVNLSTGRDYSVAQLLRDMLLINGHFSPSDLDLTAFEILRAESPGPCNYYASGDVQIRQGVADLLAGAMYWDVTPAGLLTVGLLRPPALEEPDFRVTAGNIRSIERLSTQPPYWRYRVGYDRNWGQLSADQVAEAATTTEFAGYATQPHRILEASDPNIQVDFPNAADMESPLVLPQVDERDAQLELERLWAIYGRDWECYQIAATRIGFAWRIGSVLHVTHPRFGLTSGKSFRIVSLELTEDGVTAILWALREVKVLAFEDGDLLQMEDGSLIIF